jgi:hypothetical protein
MQRPALNWFGIMVGEAIDLARTSTVIRVLNVCVSDPYC